MITIRKVQPSLHFLTKFHSSFAISSYIPKHLSVISKEKNTHITCIPVRSLMHLAPNKSDQSTSSVSDTLTEYNAYDMIHKLSENDRDCLSKALSSFEKKSKFQGKLASSNWRLKFGRRTGEQLGSVDPTGSYCAMPDDWIKKKLAEAAVRPSNDALFKIFLVNGVPFVGFGFLDNFFMIIAGDYIESSLGVYMCLSTMAAAALGNTISDVFGLGLAHYVEQFCVFIGINAPDLTPTQQNMSVTQRVGSMGRVVGITIGCLIGMFPLLFMNKESKNEDKK